MASRRDQIELTDAEQAELLDSERVVVVTTQRASRVAALDADVVTSCARASSGSGPTRSRRRSATSSATRGRRCWSRRGPSTPSCAGCRSRPRRSSSATRPRWPSSGGASLRYSEGIDSIEGDAAAALGPRRAKRVAIRFSAGPHRDLGPPQARRHLLGPGLVRASSRPQLRERLYDGFALPFAQQPGALAPGADVLGLSPAS